jgi:hypothetical protein
VLYNGVAERYGVMGFHLISPFTRAAQSLLRVRGVAICAPTMDSTADLIDFIYKRAEDYRHIGTPRYAAAVPPSVGSFHQKPHESWVVESRFRFTSENF